MELKFGVVGCGEMGRVYAAILQNDPRVRLVAVADIDPLRAMGLASECGAIPYGSLESLRFPIVMEGRRYGTGSWRGRPGRWRTTEDGAVELKSRELARRLRAELFEHAA